MSRYLQHITSAPANYITEITLSQAVIQLVSDFRWDQVTIFYQDDQDILLWSEFLSMNKPVRLLRPSFLKLPKTPSGLLQMLIGVKVS